MSDQSLRNFQFLGTPIISNKKKNADHIYMKYTHFEFIKFNTIEIRHIWTKQSNDIRNLPLKWRWRCEAVV